MAGSVQFEAAITGIWSGFNWIFPCKRAVDTCVLGGYTNIVLLMVLGNVRWRRETVSLCSRNLQSVPIEITSFISDLKLGYILLKSRFFNMIFSKRFDKSPFFWSTWTWLLNFWTWEIYIIDSNISSLCQSIQKFEINQFYKFNSKHKINSMGSSWPWFRKKQIRFWIFFYLLVFISISFVVTAIIISLFFPQLWWNPLSV